MGEAARPRAIDVARQDVITCWLDDTIADVRERVTGSPYGLAFVTTADGILLGRLRKKALDGDPHRRVAEVMERGPSTTRPDLAPATILDKLRNADLTTAVLTDPEGRLLGIALRKDLDT